MFDLLGSIILITTMVIAIIVPIGTITAILLWIIRGLQTKDYVPCILCTEKIPDTQVMVYVHRIKSYYCMDCFEKTLDVIKTNKKKNNEE